MKEKNYNLEMIRMISFILVIVIHVTNYYCRDFGGISRGEYIFSLVLDVVARISVPCFFMISGALLLGRDEPLEKHVKRLIRFFTALVVWSLIYYLWNTFYMGTEFDLAEILYVPTEAHLWYLYAMIPIYLVLPFFQVMCRGMDVKLEQAFLVVITAAVIFNYVSSLQHGEAYYDLPLIGDRVYSFYVFIGYYIYKYRKHMRIGQKAALGTFAACMALIFALSLGWTLMAGDHLDQFLAYGNPLLALGSSAFFLFVIRLGKCEITLKERTKKIIDLFCGCSFGIYLIHILFLDNYKKYMEPSDLSAWIAVPALTVCIAAASFLCVWLMRKTWAGRKIT